MCVILEMTKRTVGTLALLETFVALIDQGSVTGAASALGLTQSAVSKQLVKLRETYGDPLFVRTSQGMLPTARAQVMVPKVQGLLEELDALKTSDRFSPSEMKGDITIVTTDEIRTELSPPLLRTLAKANPQVRLNIRGLAADYAATALELGQADLVLSVDWHAPQSLRQRPLFDDQFVCLLDRLHPAAEAGFTLQSYAQARHALVAPLGMHRGYVDEVLARRRLKRHVAFSLPDFVGLTGALSGSDLVATVPQRVAHRVVSTSSGQLVTTDVPISLAPIRYYAFWHERFHASPRNQWLRGVVQQALRKPV
jgi:DNA-binding transcriptional LysR family regulator